MPNKSSLKKSFKDFLDDLENHIDIMDKISMNDDFKVVEKQYLIEAQFIKIYTGWGIFIEDLLIDCFNRNPSKFRKTTGFKIPKSLNRDLCKAILFSDGYLSLDNLDKISNISKRFLTDQFNPFKNITNLNREKINEMNKIRNYLAHRSFKSERDLRSVYKTNNVKRLIRPGRFLLATDKNSKKKRINSYLLILIRSSKQMANYLQLF